MFRLAVVTCAVLGATLAKPPPPAKTVDRLVETFDVEPVSYQDEPEPEPFREVVAKTSSKTSCTCGIRLTRVAEDHSRIVGGSAARPGQFPWQAGLVPKGGTRTFCGGSVINARYVLTAAHCTQGESSSTLDVLVGDLVIDTADSGEQRFAVDDIIDHPQYTDAVSGGYDFSLLKLDSDITFSDTIQPVCLAEAGESYAGDTAIASGFGRTGATEPQATTLQFVEVPVLSRFRCFFSWGTTITDTMLCAGGYWLGGRSVCNGDSGGPLVVEESGFFRVIGVVSFGRPCALPTTPDVYARVSEALDWIASNTADTTECTPP